MPINEKGEELCSHWVEDYGVCSRTKAHIVHQMLGMSPVEHPFRKELKGPIESTHLSEETVLYISKRSGMSEDDLRIMLASAEHQGKGVTVRYEVKE